MPTPPPGRELLAGKRVVVTAAAGTGIGSAVAERCLLEGAQVLISDIHERRLSEQRCYNAVSAVEVRDPNACSGFC